jgi:prenyltransferase beta subunit
MRREFSLLLATLLCFVATANAQTKEETAATLKWIDSLRDPATGAWAVTPAKTGEMLKPSLRACNGAVKAIRHLGAEPTDLDKVKKFVLSCYDEKTGSFSEPGGKPDASITSVGVITAIEVGIERIKIEKAMEYIKTNCKNFEDVRLAAAAVEAWGLKEFGPPPEIWSDLIDTLETTKALQSAMQTQSGNARLMGGMLVLRFRLQGTGNIRSDAIKPFLDLFKNEQRADGGWGKNELKTSDLESTYRIMRCYKMMESKPADVKKLTEFIVACRKPDGSYSVEPKADATMSGVYYAVTIQKWLAEGSKK